MRPREPLHWSALLFGIAALSWALTSAAGGFASVALVTGFAAAIVAIIAAIRLTGPARAPAFGGAFLAGLAHTIFLIAFIGANPINFKGEPGRGVNQDPPALFSSLIENVGTWIPLLLAVAIVVTFWLLWSMRDRGLGVAGLGLLVVVLLLTFAGVGETNESIGTVYQVLFAGAFLLLAAACVLPLFLSDDWPDDA